jgi:signal transduction histidine kinase
VRLLTSRTGLAAPAVLQLGRPLADQEALLGRLVAGLLGLAAATVVVAGAASWWLAGRTIAPAEQAWDRQRRFVANASHELRAPLTLLRASAEVARRGIPAAQVEARGLLDDVLGECDHIARLGDDLLLLSRGDAGGLDLARAEVSLPDLVADVGRAVARVAAERGFALDLDPGGGTVLADRARLRQVLLILLDNALGHTTAGGRVRVAASASAGTAALSVEDSGSGVSPGDLPRVFEPFYRSDGACADGRSGTGLGLAIARMLVDAHGGTIGVPRAQRGGPIVRLTCRLRTRPPSRSRPRRREVPVRLIGQRRAASRRASRACIGEKSVGTRPRTSLPIIPADATRSARLPQRGAAGQPGRARRP